MLRHVVLLRFRDDTPDDAIDAIVESLRALPAAVPSLRAYTVGRDLGLADDNADLVVVADCDDETGYAEYRDHPAHRRVIEEQILPTLESRSAAQIEF